MLNSTHVINRQGRRTAEMLRQNGVSREMYDSFLDNEAEFKKFCDKLKNGDDGWFEKLQLAANAVDARIHLIQKLAVDYGKPHNVAAIAGGPQTGSDYNVLKVADKYQPSENKATDETIILFNWPKGSGSYKKAVRWGLQNGLRLTTPHVPFAIGEQFPKLNYELGPNPMYVVETTGCSFDGGADACYLWWYDTGRRASLRWQIYFGHGYGWFSFRK